MRRAHVAILVLLTAACTSDLDDGGTGGGGVATAGSGPGTGAEMTTSSLTSSSTSAQGTGGEGGAIDPCPRLRATVDPGVPLNVRPDPSTANPPVGTLSAGDIVDRVDTVQGEVLDGNSTWYEISSPWVSGYIFSGLAECTMDLPPEPPDGYYLPLECGTTTTVTQGNNGGFSHNGDSAYAFDFNLMSGTPMVAMADGTVGWTYDGTQPGDPCYDGGGQECINEANYVTLLHADGTQTLYVHLSQVDVPVGAVVSRGTVIGHSGSTGWSTGRHAHVQRGDQCGIWYCPSIPLEFVDAGVPVTGQTVTSQNCPGP